MIQRNSHVLTSITMAWYDEFRQANQSLVGTSKQSLDCQALVPSLSDFLEA